MAGPYRATDVVVKIGSSSVGVVTALDMRFSFEGGAVEHVYGSEEGYISFGGKRATFTLARWFMTATDTDLLWDLFINKLAFGLTGELSGVSESTFGISNCKASSWRPILGDANTIVGEEIAGEGIAFGPTDI